MELPFNEEYRAEFEMVLDEEMFEPLCGKKRSETDTTGCIDIDKKIKNGQIGDLVKRKKQIKENY
jgi:hypothetical protein